MKTFILLLFFIKSFAEPDSVKPSENPSFIKKFIQDPTGFVYKPKPYDSAKYNRKHQVVLNLMGSTPIFGLEYSYRLWENKSERITIETGLGLGANSLSATDFQRYRKKNIFPFNASHHLRVVFFRNWFIYPYIGYYGILTNGSFANQYAYYYRPNLGGGFRFGDSDRLAIQFGATAYFNCCISGRQDSMETVRFYTWVLPSASLHIALGKN